MLSYYAVSVWKKKLSLKQVSDSLKLPPDRLEELENKTSMDSLNPFERGHLRNYAALLDIDLTPFMLSKNEAQKFSADLKSVEQQNLNVRAPENSRRVYWIIVWALILVAGYFLVSGLMESDMGERVNIPNIMSESIDLEPSHFSEPAELERNISSEPNQETL